MSYLNERPENNHQAKARAVTIALKRNLFPKKNERRSRPNRGMGDSANAITRRAEHYRVTARDVPPRDSLD
jgi:hypothetical protein